MEIFRDIMGYIGAVFISIAFLPQTYKLFITKDTKGLSLTSYSIYHIGLTLFIIYASFTHNYPLLAANAFGWIVNLGLLILICYNLYHNKGRQEHSKKDDKTTKNKKNKT